MNEPNALPPSWPEPNPNPPDDGADMPILDPSEVPDDFDRYPDERDEEERPPSHALCAALRKAIDALAPPKSLRCDGCGSRKLVLHYTADAKRRCAHCRKAWGVRMAMEVNHEILRASWRARTWQERF